MLAITAHSFDSADRPVYVHRRAVDVASRLTRRNDAFDIARAIGDPDSFDDWLVTTRQGIALGLAILRAQRAEVITPAHLGLDVGDTMPSVTPDEWFQSQDLAEANCRREHRDRR